MIAVAASLLERSENLVTASLFDSLEATVPAAKLAIAASEAAIAAARAAPSLVSSSARSSSWFD